MFSVVNLSFLFLIQKRKGGFLLTDTEISEILKKENDEYKKLYEEHKQLEQVLADIDRNKYLTPEEEMERKRIQKQKLIKKDRMAELIRKYKQKVKS